MFTGGWCLAHTPLADTPLRRHSLADTPSLVDTPDCRHTLPWQTRPLTDTPPGRHPLPDIPPGRHPLADTPPSPWETTPWADTPGRHTPFPREDTPPRQTTRGDGHCTGRYASYWNLFLLLCALISAVSAAFCTSRGPSAHLWRTPLHWRAFDVALAMSQISVTISLKNANIFCIFSYIVLLD